MDGNNLNVFKFTSGYSKRFVFKNIKQFFKNIKYACQRATKGYCDRDLWDFYLYLTELLKNSIDEFRATTHTYPGVFDENENGYEKWLSILSEISSKLQTVIDLDDSNSADELLDKISNCSDKSEKESLTQLWINKMNSNSIRAEKEINSALKLLSQYWFNLWD